MRAPTLPWELVETVFLTEHCSVNSHLESLSKDFARFSLHKHRTSFSSCLPILCRHTHTRPQQNDPKNLWVFRRNRFLFFLQNNMLANVSANIWIKSIWPIEFYTIRIVSSQISLWIWFWMFFETIQLDAFCLQPKLTSETGKRAGDDCFFAVLLCLCKERAAPVVWSWKIGTLKVEIPPRKTNLWPGYLSEKMNSF